MAIHLGHRESIDLDWFSSEKFSSSEIKNELSKIGKFELNNEEDGTVHGTVDNVKISFLHYPYSQLFPLINFEGTNLADERDIAGVQSYLYRLFRHNSYNPMLMPFRISEMAFVI